jgi:hypothetical protein
MPFLGCRKLKYCQSADGKTGQLRRAVVLLVLKALGLLGLGYLIGAFGGGLLIEQFSTNRHDRAVEAAMTGAFVTGPVGALLFLVIGLAWLRLRARSRRGSNIR